MNDKFTRLRLITKVRLNKAAKLSLGTSTHNPICRRNSINKQRILSIPSVLDVTPSVNVTNQSVITSINGVTLADNRHTGLGALLAQLGPTQNTRSGAILCARRTRKIHQNKFTFTHNRQRTGQAQHKYTSTTNHIHMISNVIRQKPRVHQAASNSGRRRRNLNTLNKRRFHHLKRTVRHITVRVHILIALFRHTCRQFAYETTRRVSRDHKIRKVTLTRNRLQRGAHDQNAMFNGMTLLGHTSQHTGSGTKGPETVNNSTLQTTTINRQAKQGRRTTRLSVTRVHHTLGSIGRNPT